MNDQPLVLSLFPGIGLLDMAFEFEGFCVVRGPDLLWGGDVRRFHPPIDAFDGVIGGPPCQQFSRLRHLVKHNGYQIAENLIPEFERVVYEAAPKWFVMENVEDAPAPYVPGLLTKSLLVRDVWVGGATSRLRRFSFGTLNGVPLQLEGEALFTMTPAPAVCASDGGRAVPVKIGGSGKLKRCGAALLTDRSSRTFSDACVLQGLPGDFLSDAPFTYKGKRQAIGNGVPLQMGRAVARAVKQAMGYVFDVSPELSRALAPPGGAGSRQT